MTALTAVKQSEKRRYPRVPLAVNLDIQLMGHPIGRVRGEIDDLSPAGMTFKTDAELEQGMCLHLQLHSSLQIRGEVRHMKTANVDGGLHRYGIRFHKIGFGETQSAKPLAPQEK